ncbi:putative PEX3 peroxisomal biogenesis factor 3 [Podospora fimiseda]|uniref:PEX3 peroxisomal biogenesis factor 3 n=1 Tax=Podospora fimiseda TaxID=252190 RepID=A0AAN7BR14_9PEZI|nr:putative PEX3 peroxisomal biogenesis factor 3 [Podospora fimiseda]
MLAASRRWLKRNRTPLAIGAGVIGAGYVVTGYVLGKLQDARERMSSDRIAKENLRRRFEQNQEDCTFTVLALLPTATAAILEAMNTEKITFDIQQLKGPNSAVARAKSIGSTGPPSISAETNFTDEDGRSIISVSVQSEAGLHTTQLSVPPPLTTPNGNAEGAGATEGTASQESASLLAPPRPRKSKRQLWNDLTISSISRSYTLLYTLGLLTMLTRIQLNLLGRRSYLSSVVSLATAGTQATISLENNDDDNPDHYYGSDFEVNRRYLTFSWWLINRGWVDVMQRVETSVRQVFGHLSPRDTVTLDTFGRLTADVRRLVEGASPANGMSTAWLPVLLPPKNMEEFVLRESGVLDEREGSSPNPSSEVTLRRLLDETADLIESPPFATVLTQLLDKGFSVLLEQKLVTGTFNVAGAVNMNTADGGISSAVPLPKILSILTRQAHVIGNGVPNEYLHAMEQVKDLEGFAAVVYSSNWQAEIAADEAAEEAAAKQQQQQSQQQQGASTTKHRRQSQESTVVGNVEESVVVVGNDPQASFEGAWERATTGSNSGK